MTLTQKNKQNRKKKRSGENDTLNREERQRKEENEIVTSYKGKKYSEHYLGDEFGFLSIRKSLE